jgi:hypothetical protein
VRRDAGHKRHKRNGLSAATRLLFTEALPRRSVAEITAGLIPARQRRGVRRWADERGSTLRNNLMEF